MEKEAYLNELLKVHESRFLEFVQKFYTGDPERDANITLKKEHTMRVYVEAGRLVRQLEMNDPASCLLAALYHDVGRFPQLAQYNTFNDRISVNHGAMGARTILREDLLRGMTAESKRSILVAVALHNRMDIPAGLPADMRQILRVVRDSDKIDIMNVLLEEFEATDVKNGTAIMNLVDEQSSYSASCLQTLQSKQCIRYDQMHFLNDFKMLLLSWAFSLEFRQSLCEVNRRGYLNRLFESLASLPELFAFRDDFSSWLRKNI